MTWVDHYREQAQLCREQAAEYARYGLESKARHWLDNAEAYEMLADREQANSQRRVSDDMIPVSPPPID